jgi:hypothetical protein
MRSSYLGYFRPTPEEFKKLWDACLFVFDTSVLLNFYEYSPETTENLKTVMRAMKDRLWLPHHIGWEFLKERRNVIDKQKKPYDESSKKLNEVLGAISAKDSHPFLSQSCLEPLKAAIEGAQKEFELAKDALEHMHENDNHLTFLETLFEGRVGPAYSVQDRAEIEREGQKRYEEKRPPGYLDKKSKDDVTDNRCGDYVIWRQMKEKAKTQKQSIVFITDDAKEDTWLKHKDKTIGPRPEMLEEFLSETGQKLYVYSASAFLKQASSHFNVAVDQSTIDEADTLRTKKQELAMAEANLQVVELRPAVPRWEEAANAAHLGHVSNQWRIVELPRYTYIIDGGSRTPGVAHLIELPNTAESSGTNATPPTGESVGTSTAPREQAGGSMGAPA